MYTLLIIPLAPAGRGNGSMAIISGADRRGVMPATRLRHGQASRVRRPVGEDRTIVAPRAPETEGRLPPAPARAALTGILFVLRTGIPWEDLPVELGCGSGTTCWRRLRDWHRAGVWHRLHQVLLHELGGREALDWFRAALDTSSVPAKRGAPRPARIRRIAANRARRGIWWSTASGSRSR